MNQKITIPVEPSGGAAPPPPMPQPFTLRLVIGMIGILIASMFSGLNDRVTDIALDDVQGALNISSDPGSWTIGAYQAAEVAAMMLAPWFSMTFSLRRFAIGVCLGFSLLALILPYSPNINVFIALRVIQGIFGGALPPLLMTVALRFLPPKFKLYGLSAYVLTATFGPNVATTLAAFWTDVVGWQWVFWQVIPPCLLAAGLVGYGIPQDPVRFERFKQIDIVGMLTGTSGIALMVLVLQQGQRLDWLNSPLIVVMLLSSIALLLIFFINEWSHPLPLFKLQMLKRHNLSHGLLTLGGLMVLVLSGSALPSSYMESVQGFRAVQVGPLALTIGLPQLIIAPLVAAVLNLRWIDSRLVLIIGLALIGISCYGGSHITEGWARENFYWLQAMQAFGQPMAILPVLMGATGVVQPPEGPFASAMFNTVRGFSSVLGSALVGEFSSKREQFHSNVLLNHVGNVNSLLSQPYDGDGTYLAPLNPDGSSVSTQALSAFSSLVKRQATILGISDSYLMIIGIAFALGLLTLLLPKRTYPPQSLVKKSD